MEIVVDDARASPLPRDKRIYNIAVYGLSGSGKTCLLAALAMDRYPNPFGFSATWLTTAEQTGKEWLEQAIRFLEHNQVPPPNPNTHEQLTFDFTFSHRGRSYQVRMFDYSGELVNPTLSDMENTKALFKKLEGMDALLILAPAPHPNDDHRQISKDLHGLQRTFASFRAQRDASRRKLPIALLYNMWDRRSKLEHETPENEWQELEEFLQLQQPALSLPIPHRQFYDAVQNGLVPDAAAYQIGELWQRYCAFREGRPIRCNLMAFPVSAFGAYITETIYNNGETNLSFERPKEINPLHSFGLEDPFVWALYRCQELEAEAEDQEDAASLERLDYAASQLAGVKQYYRWVGLRSTGKLIAAAKQLSARLAEPGAALRRYPELQNRRLERRVQVDNLYTRLRRIWSTQSVVATAISMILAISLVATGEFVWDSQEFPEAQAILSNPESTLQNRQWADAWQDAYVHSPLWRHAPYTLLQAKAQVEQTLQHTRAVHEQLIAKKFTDSSKDLGSRFQAATEYLQICTGAQCINTPEAQAVVQEYRQAQDTAAWEQARLANTGDAINDYLAHYPLGNHANAARDALRQLMQIADWQKFKANYDEQIKNGEVLEAAKLLRDRPQAPDPEATKLRAGFPDWAIATLAAKVAVWKDHQNWSEAVSYLQQLRQIPVDVWASERQRNSLIDSMLADIKQTWDKSLYQTTCDFRTSDKVNDYLSQAPIATMKQEVERYQGYLNHRAGANQFQLLLTRVVWNDNVSSKTHAIFSLTAQGINAVSPQLDGPSAEMNPAVNLPIDFTAQYTDTIAVAVGVTGYGWLGTKPLGASEQLNLSIQDISVHGATVTLRDEQGTPTGMAYLAVKGGAGPEPELPTWRSN